jgi:hypothetical protein
MDRRSDLDRDRPAQLGLGGGGLGGGTDQKGAGSGDAVGGQQLPGSLGTGPSAGGLAGQDLAGQCAAPARVDARGRHDVARGPGPPFRPPGDPPERGGGFLRVGEDRNAGVGQAGRRGPGYQEDREDGRDGQGGCCGGDLAGDVLGGDERRDVHRDDRVDLLCGADLPQRPPVLLRGGAGHGVHRVPDGGLRRQAGAQRGLGVVGQFRHQQPGRLAGVSDQDARTAAIGQHRDPPSSRYRLGRQHGGDVEHLFQRVRPDHPGLMEQRLHRRLPGRERRGVRGRRPPPGTGTAGFHRHDGLVPGDAPGDPGEPAGIGHRLQIGQDDVGGGILVPVQEQVVGRQVHGIANRHKGADAQQRAAEQGERGQPEPAGLTDERQVARRREGRAEGRVEPGLWPAIEQAHAVGPDQPHPRGPGAVA